MSGQDKKPEADEAREREDQKDADLCCCYLMNEDGTYEDPCNTPADECCC